MNELGKVTPEQVVNQPSRRNALKKIGFGGAAAALALFGREKTVFAQPQRSTLPPDIEQPDATLQTVAEGVGVIAIGVGGAIAGITLEQPKTRRELLKAAGGGAAITITAGVLGVVGAEAVVDTFVAPSQVGE